MIYLFYRLLYAISFVPEVGFSNFNRVSYQPRVEVEVPTVQQVAPYAPAVLHETYGPPIAQDTYGLPPVSTYVVSN